ncbi:hypothetical protein [Geobacter sulfurreducens]|uniref:hypothetical protein n=1 Tax=Geobacter sulfurreducens TaxID=35554 RepID=UPI000DBB8868|nr:hypothetical protein [Geobacter sulfurreducens]BBA71774.1 hypothetical protein YM18_3266 [Geobacter sulfurreducens]
MLRNIFVTIAAAMVLGLAAAPVGAVEKVSTNAAAAAQKKAGSGCCMKETRDGRGCCCCCCDCDAPADGSCCKKCGKGRGTKRGCAKQGMGPKDCPAASGQKDDAPADR